MHFSSGKQHNFMFVFFAEHKVSLLFEKRTENTIFVQILDTNTCVWILQ